MTFDANGGEGGTSGKQDYGSAITAPTVTRTGYTFTGWSPEVAATVPADDVTYVAQWSINQYTVTFNANGGEGGTSGKQDYGSAITAPTVTREGHTFTGWSPSVAATVPANDVTYTAQWSINQYTVTFDANGGEGGTSGKQDYGSTITAPTVTREGYTFTGWTPDVPASVPASNATYTAQWSINQYTVTFDANGGDGGTSGKQDYGSTITAPTIAREGYTFAGWSPSVAATVPANDVTYAAQWSINQYTVTFNANGGDGGTSDKQDFGSAITAPTVTREGYTFNGWSPSVAATVPANDVTYTAQWTANTYTVKFNGNGADGGSMDPMFCTYDVATNLTPCAFTRTDYEFTGWTNSTGVTFADRATVSNLTANAGAEVELFARWSVTLAAAADAPGLEFETKGTVGSFGCYDEDPTNADWFAQADCYEEPGTSAVQSGALPTGGYSGYSYVSWLTTTITGKGVLSFSWRCDAKSRAEHDYEYWGDVFRFGRLEGNSLTAVADVPELEGHTGWQHATYTKTTAGEEKIAWAFMFMDGGDKNGGGTGYVDHVTWSPGYEVALDRQGGSGGTESVIAVCDAAMPAITLPVREGYTFGGYWTAENGGGTKYYNSDGTSAANWDLTSDTTLYAKWTPIMYTMTFDANGGDGGTSVTQDYGTAITAPTVTREGYTFNGWSPSVPATVPVGGGTYTAQWSINQYTVTFDANGGDGGTSGKQDYGSAITAPTVTREGHTFTGWSPSVAATVPANDVTYTAQWSVNQYTVTFDANGGEGGTSGKQDYGSTITAPTVTREGYTFMGWSPSVAATVPANDVTYVAQWSINQYTISFNSNGGTAVDPITHDYGTAISAPAAPTKEGYTFAGWSPAVPSTMPAENKTVTAQWSVNQYTVTFDANGGEGGTSGKQDYGSTITAPTVTREGYTFTGWTPDVPASVPASNATYTAQWSINQYTVTFDANGGDGGTSGKQDYGSTITAPTIAREGYTFAGWSPSVAATVPANDVTYAAQWTANTYTVNFYSNGADGGEAMDPMTCTYDVPTNLTQCAFNYTGYAFVGWTNSVGDVFADGALVSNLTATANGTVTLYAQWGDALAVALDAPRLEFATKGTYGSYGYYDEDLIDANWFAQSGCGEEAGTSAAQCGAWPNSTISGYSYVSWLTTTVTGKGVLSFSWKCDAKSREKDEFNDSWGDVFRFGRLDGNGLTAFAEVPELEGNTGWKHATYTKTTDDPETFAWAFMYMDGGYNNGGGTGYVDRVTWTPSE